ncbi:hypothetical protein [Streptomyces sp. NPDC020996]|uniref:hypothetical protein n=1 Tax=Streptomyces sp. NPDC020996 TaxID=3154791 RepID=UPI0033E497D8
MSTGSARPRRRRAAPGGLRYEHRPGLPRPEKPREGEFGCGAAVLVLLAALAVVVPPAMARQEWGEDVWGDLAPSWPGGGYAFAACVGVLVPVAFGALMTPLFRMDWKKRKARSLGWAVAALPGLAACEALMSVITGVARPKHERDWDGACYSEGNPCWVHVHYPFVWAVGLAATVAASALLIALLVRRARPAGASATPPGTSGP